MTGLLIFLLGFVVGAVLMRVRVAWGEHRQDQARVQSPHELSGARAVVRYLRTHGTVNVPRVAALLSVDTIVAMRTLDQLEASRLVKAQRHRGSDAFYTLV